MVRELESRGQEVVTLSGGAPGAPRLRASWRELFAGLPDSRPLRGVVHVGHPVEEAGGVLAERTPASLAADVEEMAGSALALAQGLGDAGVRPELGLSFVTRGGQLLERESGGGLASSVLWGFGRSLARESGELGVRLLDVDSGAVSAGKLAEELLHPDGEPEVLYRGATRRVARLARVPSSAEGGIREAVRNDRSYLVTGGLGGIGLEVAGWLAERGAGAIVLNGRRAPDAGAAAAVEALKERGVEVRVELADVTDEAAVRDLLHRVDAELPPLGGVIHSVGVVSDAAVENQDWGRFEEVLWPKVLGAWNVHRGDAGPGAGSVRAVFESQRSAGECGSGELRGGECVPGPVGAPPSGAGLAGSGDCVGGVVCGGRGGGAAGAARGPAGGGGSGGG